MNAQPRNTRFSCPCCGGDIGQAAALQDVRKAVTQPTALVIFDALSKNAGAPVTRGEILKAVVGAQSRWTPRISRNIDNQVSNLRKTLAAFGWTISHMRGGKGDMANWRLIPTEASA